jgi:hypothetical protein
MMNREAGNPTFPIWLLGDSNPPQWQISLLTPLDPRHPVRHNIWTPILDVIQDRVFRELRARIDTSSIYIRNAVEDPELKRISSDLSWGTEIQKEIDLFGALITTYRPQLVLCFGRFAFEFARRAIGELNHQRHGYWKAITLGAEFRKRISEFSPNRINVLPLLHRSISGGKFIQSHDQYCGVHGANYFEMTGNGIAEQLIRYHAKLRLWIE